MTVLKPIRAGSIALLLVGLHGCQGAASSSNEAWSTKDNSVLGNAPVTSTLNVTPLPAEITAESAMGPMVSPAELRAAAIDVLLQALDAEQPLLRANAIEGLQGASEYIDGAVRRGLADDNRGIRFVAAMTVGKQKLSSLTFLLEPLLEDPSESVRAAAIYGLHQNGVAVDLGPLLEMLNSDDPEVKGNAAMVLGDIGDPTALPMLQLSMGRGLERTTVARARLVDMQIAEALVELGDEREIEGIRAALFAPPEQGEMTALACQMVARLDDGRAVVNLADLANRTGSRQQSPEVRMAAMTALAEIQPDMASLQVPMTYANDPRADLRGQAAMTMGAVNRPEALPTLTRLLGDPNPLVQVSAAAAILRIVPES